MWLTRSMEAPCRRVPAANLILRGSGALVALALVTNTQALDILPAMPGAQTLIAIHIAFNAALLPLAFTAPLLEPALSGLFKNPKPLHATPTHHRSVLEADALNSPVRAMASLRRETLRMSDILSGMLAPIMELYVAYDKERARSIRAEDDHINDALDAIRRYAAKMPHDRMAKGEMKEMRALVDYAIALEAAGDIVVKRLLPLAAEKASHGLQFSKPGFDELRAIHERVVRNLATASSVLISNDVESARLLLEEKAEMARQERHSRKLHLKRLTEGEQDSFGSSDIHLETAYSLKEFNSWIVTVAHPILIREGQLLESRLIKEMKPDSQ
jgi:phosphate:Na+ symporter